MHDFDEAARERCAVRRAQGIPTVAVVIGDARAVELRTARLAAIDGLAVSVVARADDARSFLRAFFEGIERGHDGILFYTKSRADQLAHFDPMRSEGGAMERLVEAVAERRDETFAQTLERSGTNDPAHGVDEAALIAAGGRLFGWARAPVVLARIDDDTTLRAASAIAVEIAERAASADLLLSIDATTWFRGDPETRTSHANAVLEETVFSVIGAPAREQPYLALLDEGRNIGAQTRRADVPGATRREQSAILRSVAERIAHESLALNRYTRGCFEPNGKLDVIFGNAPMEIDLLSRSHRIAIEIDGYHHFRDAEAYRRDRRKDRLLQRQGYFVARFLADDIVDDPSAFVSAVVGFVLDAKGGHA